LHLALLLDYRPRADSGDISGDLIDPIETDHGRLKSRLRPMRGLKRLRSPQVISGWRFPHRLATAFAELTFTV
jgi:hypothetical protein